MSLSGAVRRRMEQRHVAVERWIAAVGVLCGTLLTAAWLLLRSPGGEPPAGGPSTISATPAAQGREEPAPAASLGEPRAPTEAPAAPVSRSEEPAEASPRAAFTAQDLGRFEVEPCDLRSGALLEGATVRLLGERRYAEASGGPVELWLTPDDYQVSIARAGFETRVLSAPACMRAGDVVDLGAVGLERGAGRIYGRVRAPSLPADAAIEVELTGRGRGPCDRCGWPAPLPEGERPAGEEEGADAPAQGEGAVASEPPPEPTAAERLKAGFERGEPCGSCGFSADRSRAVVRPGGEFVFEHLAAGSYRLQAWHGELHPLGHREILELGRGDSWYADVELCASALVEFELLDRWGMPFSPSDVSAQCLLGAGGIHYTFLRDGQPLGSARAPVGIASPVRRGEEALRAWLSFGQAHFDLDQSWTIALESLGQETFAARETGGLEPHDRPREEADLLVLPAPSEPIGEVGFPALVLEPHRHRIGPLPCEDLLVEVGCGEFGSGPVPVTPVRGALPIIPIVMWGTDRPRLEAQASCQSCHDAGKDRPASLSLQISFGNVTVDGAVGQALIDVYAGPAPEAPEDGR